MNRGLLRGIPAKPELFSIAYVIDGGAATITTGIKGELPIPKDCDVVAWEITGDQSGAIVVDLWRAQVGYFSTISAANSICGTDKPTIAASGVYGSSENLGSWTTNLRRGEWLRFNVDSVTSIRRATVSLLVSPRFA